MEIPLHRKNYKQSVRWEFWSFRGNHFLTLTNLFTYNMKFILPIYFQLCAVCYVPYMNNLDVFHFLPVLLSLFIMSHAHILLSCCCTCVFGLLSFLENPSIQSTVSTNCAPPLADLFLYSNEADLIQDLLNTKEKTSYPDPLISQSAIKMMSFTK